MPDTPINPSLADLTLPPAPEGREHVIGLRVKTKRLPDGTCEIFLQSDVLEDWFIEQSKLDTVENEVRYLEQEVNGIKGYKTVKANKSLGSITSYLNQVSGGALFGSWNVPGHGHTHHIQLVRAVGLKDGITAILPTHDGYPYTSDRMNEMRSMLENVAKAIYTQFIHTPESQSTFVIERKVSGNARIVSTEASE